MHMTAVCQQYMHSHCVVAYGKWSQFCEGQYTALKFLSAEICHGSIKSVAPGVQEEYSSINNTILVVKQFKEDCVLVTKQGGLGASDTAVTQIIINTTAIIVQEDRQITVYAYIIIKCIIIHNKWYYKISKA